MKSLKKFLALALALALCFAMALPAMAEGEDALPKNATITIEGAEGHTYKVYQIYTGDLSKNDDGELVLSNVKYGKNYGTEGQYVPQEELKGITDAEAFAQKIRGENGGLIEPSIGTLSSENEWTLSEIGEDLLPNGYYLIVDEGIASDENPNSAYIVQALGNTTLKPKVTKPTLDKEVKKADGEYSGTDTVDTEIGKSVGFKLTAEVPVAELSQYATAKGSYELVFKDTMSKGLTYDGNDTIKVYTKAEAEENLVENGEEKTLYTVADSVINDTTGETSISVTIPNLFEIVGKTKEAWTKYVVDGNLVIVVTYTATLNEDAIVNNGSFNGETNFNKAHLEYDNNPYGDGTGNTPDDETFVYSFMLDITKYENDVKADQELGGAGFTLYRSDAEQTKGDKLWFKPITVEAVYEDDGTTIKTPGYTKYVLCKQGDAGAQDVIYSAEETGKLNFAGLEAGYYYLEETNPPEGFNKCQDQVIQIKATHADGDKEAGSIVNQPQMTVFIVKTPIANTTGTGNEGTSGSEESAGTALNIINKSGTNLPSTGGIGTTIFYAVGGALVVGAGILLFVKKRMGSKG